jgi:voltage-gated potassium channel
MKNVQRLSRRQFVYQLLHTPEVETNLERKVRMGLGVIIMLSMLSVVLETEDSLAFRYHAIFFGFEILTVAVFSLEYVLRLWSCVEMERYDHPILGRIKYAASPMALIDLAAIMPVFVAGFSSIDLRFLRALRLIALTRTSQLGEYSRSIGSITRAFQKRKHEMIMSLYIIVVLLVFSATIMYYIEYAAQPEVFRSIPAALWWGVSTLTTVGYGDMYPITVLGKVCSAVISILGISTFAIPSGILASAFMEEMKAEVEKAVEVFEESSTQVSLYEMNGGVMPMIQD